MAHNSTNTAAPNPYSSPSSWTLQECQTKLSRYREVGNYIVNWYNQLYPLPSNWERCMSEDSVARRYWVSTITKSNSGVNNIIREETHWYECETTFESSAKVEVDASQRVLTESLMVIACEAHKELLDNMSRYEAVGLGHYAEKYSDWLQSIGRVLARWLSTEER